MRKKSFQRRKSFLVDSNMSPRKRPKRVRNKFLNTFTKLLAFKNILKWFQLKNIGILLMVCMAGFVIFALGSPYFKLKNINVNRNNPNIDIEQIQTSLESFYGENLLFLSKQSIEGSLRTEFPEFDTITIEEQWPDTISLSLETAPAVFLLINKADATFYSLTEKGIVLPSDTKEPESDLPSIELNQYEKPIQVRTNILTQEEIKFIQETQEFVRTELKLTPKQTKYLWAARELHIVVHESTELWFDITYSSQEQTQRLLWALDEINFYSRPPQHVDLRIPSQLYWAP